MLLTAQEVAQRDILSLVQAAAVPASTFCGVYFLFDQSELVYIDQSKNVYSRIPCHARRFQFDRVAFIEVEPHNLLTVERALIWKYRPRFNAAVAFAFTDAEMDAAVASIGASCAAFIPKPVNVSDA